MTTNHTPGPWVRDTASGFGCDVRAENGRKVAATWGINNGDPYRPAYRAECDANARLIAAAPELLEVLEDLTSHMTCFLALNQHEPGGEFEQWAERALAAVAKARGAQ